MDSVLFEALLNEDESESLDFKREQYLFDGATDEQKSELLKDILALTNAWRRTDAYILIGVEENKGGRSNVVGVTHQLNDASLQQFVNSKAQRPVFFLYETFSFEGVQVGIIRVSSQDRPLFLIKDYGKLKKNTVYIRRGSSTTTADPDEIAKMGVATIQQKRQPEFQVQFADISKAIGLGNEINLNSELIEYDESEIPNVPFFWQAIQPGKVLNQQYMKQNAKYVAEKSLLNPVRFLLKNVGTGLASNVLMAITHKIEKHIIVMDENRRTVHPWYNIKYMIIKSFNDLPVMVENQGENWTATIRFPSIFPQQAKFSQSALYIGALEPCQIELDAFIFADGLNEPAKLPLSLNFTVVRRKLNLKEIKRRSWLDL